MLQLTWRTGPSPASLCLPSASSTRSGCASHTYRGMTRSMVRKLELSPNNAEEVAVRSRKESRSDHGSLPAILPLLPVTLHRAVPVLRKRLAVDPHGSRPFRCSRWDGLIPKRDLPCERWSWSGRMVTRGCWSVHRRGARAHLPFVAPSAHLRTRNNSYISAAWQSWKFYCIATDSLYDFALIYNDAKLRTRGRAFHRDFFGGDEIGL